MLRRGSIVVSLAVIALLGFYAGRTILPGIYGQGAGAITPPVSSTTPPPSPGPAPAPAPPPSKGPAPSNGPTKDTYWIDVDVTAQKVRIMQGDKAIKTMVASTGVQGAETPLGTFEIQNRGEWFFSDKYREGAKYWVSFRDWGVYLFHSIVMDADQKVIPEEEAKLGKPASHGCVRLPITDAKWIYDNIPERTKVVIHT